MNDRELRPLVLQQIKALQITIGALVVGAMAMGIVAIVLHAQGLQVVIAAIPLLSLIAVLQAAAILAVRPVVLSSMLRNAREKITEQESQNDEIWMRILGSMTITGAALLEGGAFLFFIAYMLEGQWWALAGGVAMVGLMCAWHFPTQSKVTAWIEEQRQSGPHG
jgi:Na+/melibiose symporter-like transporter